MQTRQIHSILVIDDDEDDFELVSEAFGEIDNNISVSYIQSCEDVKQYKGRNFDLVLLDINMPRHDGFSWLKGIREKGFNDLPVIMYTSSSNPDNIARAYHDGANLYFTKPENFNNLVKGLKKIINMDWSNPYSITQLYNKNGKYTTFQIA